MRLSDAASWLALRDTNVATWIKLQFANPKPDIIQNQTLSQCGRSDLTRRRTFQLKPSRRTHLRVVYAVTDLIVLSFSINELSSGRKRSVSAVECGYSAKVSERRPRFSSGLVIGSRWISATTQVTRNEGSAEQPNKTSRMRPCAELPGYCVCCHSGEEPSADVIYIKPHELTLGEKKRKENIRKTHTCLTLLCMFTFDRTEWWFQTLTVPLKGMWLVIYLHAKMTYP